MNIRVRRVGAILTLFLFVGLWFAPLRLEPQAHRLVALFGAVLVAWLTEVVPVAVTALMIAPLLVVLGITDPKSAFRWYADPILYLFVGGFMIAGSMQRHGLDRRIAHGVVSIPFVRNNPRRQVIAIVVTATVLSMWISNTATCAIFVPILLGLPGIAQSKHASKYLLALGYVCSTGGVGTLVGTPPNLIAARLLQNSDIHIGFVEWLVIGVPAAAATSFVAAAITMGFGGREESESEAANTVEAAISPSWSRGEIITAVAFAIAVAGWTLPPFLELARVPGAGELTRLLHPGAVAVLACLPLLTIPDPTREDCAVLPWPVASRSVDWGIILLFGSGIALGTQLEETGLASALSQSMVEMTGATDVWTLSFTACATTIVVSEIASNTAAANILIPLIIALARELDVSPIPPALAVGLGASVGFMLPIATGANAMVYATGRVPQSAMMRAGFGLDIACLLVVMAILRVVCPIMGWV